MVYRFAYKTYRLPLRAPLLTAHGPWLEREGLIVRLEDEVGRVGFGEIAPLPWFGTETLAGAEEICRKIGAKVAGEALDAVPEHLGCVRFALGQARELPGKVATTTRLPVAALLPAGRVALKALPAKLEAGFLAFKWKVGVGAVDDELVLLDDLLALLPASARLRLDANGGWNRSEAGRWLGRCADRPVEFVEQPVAPAEEDTLLGLARDYPVTIALDESVVRLAGARRWQGRGWPGVFVIKPALAGPLDELVKWVAATKPDVVLSSAIETALGRAAILRAALSQPLTKRALGFGPGGVFGDRRWDGLVIGPLADASCIATNPGEEIWKELT
ncbi:MAG: o-succinylbenzoate synthase [Lacunisphaera sp.]|nr:o-succinylbenzoate synthase [Lacunisphaera sp.]